MYEAILAMQEGLGVKRFHTHRTLLQQSVGEHSASVALLVHLITSGQCRKELYLAALVDDLAEYWTGDIPSPYKRSVGGLRERVHEDGVIWLDDRGFPPIQLTTHEKNVLKLADALDGLLFCAREVEIGNRVMLGVGDTFLGYAKELMESVPSENRGVAEHVVRIWNRAAKGRAG